MGITRGGGPERRSAVAAELSRRQFLTRSSLLGAGALVASALPVAERMAVDPALAQAPLADATLQAFADTIVPGRIVERTELGDVVHPGAILGVDPEPGAVETDALRLYNSPYFGFDAFAPPFLTDLSARSLEHGSPSFVALDYERRSAVLLDGFSYNNPGRTLYVLATAIAFWSFTIAAAQVEATSETSAGYRVMGFPGAAPHGYPGTSSYGIVLATDSTADGNLP